MTTEDEKRWADLDEKHKAYSLAFGSPAGKAVLEDLARYCKINTSDSVFVPGDVYETMMRLGTQEMFRYICAHLELTTEQLVRLYYPGGKV